MHLRYVHRAKALGNDSTCEVHVFMCIYMYILTYCFLLLGHRSQQNGCPQTESPEMTFLEAQRGSQAGRETQQGRREIRNTHAGSHIHCTC